MKKGYGYKFKITAIILSAILSVGVLTQSVTLFCLNLLLNPSAYSLQEHKLIKRLYLLRLSERIASLICLSYMIGVIVFAIILILSQRKISKKQMFLFPITQITLVGVCTIPFTFMDRSFYGDYLDMFISTSASLLVVFFVCATALFITNRYAAWKSKQKQVLL